MGQQQQQSPGATAEGETTGEETKSGEDNWQRATKELSKQEKMRIQQVLGTVLFCAIAVDPTMLMALNAIAAEQEHPTQKQPQ